MYRFIRDFVKYGQTFLPLPTLDALVEVFKVILVDT